MSIYVIIIISNVAYYYIWVTSKMEYVQKGFMNIEELTTRI